MIPKTSGGTALIEAVMLDVDNVGLVKAILESFLKVL